MELLQRLLSFLQTNIFSVKIKPNKYRNQPYILSSNVTRKFPGNSVLFVNFGTSQVVINDVFPLLPSIAVIRPVGARISFNGNQNEEDNTYYKITFDPTPGLINSLGVYVKEDASFSGSEPDIEHFDRDVMPTDKRQQDKEKNRTKGNF